MIFALGCGKFVELRISDEPPKWFQDQITKPAKKRSTQFVPLTQAELAEYQSLTALGKQQYAMRHSLRYDYSNALGPVLNRLSTKYETVQVPLVSATGWDGGVVVTSMTRKAFHALTGVTVGNGECHQMGLWGKVSA